MSHMMEHYDDSDPGRQARRIHVLLKRGVKCPQCGTVAKWQYYYHEVTNPRDTQNRCTAHEIVPTPGPRSLPDVDKIGQLY